jgi:hypothetical protein
MRKSLAFILIGTALLTTFSQAQLFTGGQNCVACLGSKRLICENIANGTGCFDSFTACPQAQWRTNIFTQCSSLVPPTTIVRSTNTLCQRNILMNATVGQRPDIQFNETLLIPGDQFCTVALVNNQDKPVNYRLTGNNNATVSFR